MASICWLLWCFQLFTIFWPFKYFEKLYHWEEFFIVTYIKVLFYLKTFLWFGVYFASSSITFWISWLFSYLERYNHDGDNLYCIYNFPLYFVNAFLLHSSWRLLFALLFSNSFYFIMFWEVISVRIFVPRNILFNLHRFHFLYYGVYFSLAITLCPFSFPFCISIFISYFEGCHHDGDNSLRILHSLFHFIYTCFTRFDKKIAMWFAVFKFLHFFVFYNILRGFINWMTCPS